MKNKWMSIGSAVFALSLFGIAFAQETFSHYPTSNREFVVTLGDTTRCSVANNSDRAVHIKTITFTFRCDGLEVSATRNAPMTVFPGSYRNIDVLPGQICGLVEPISCSATTE